MAKRVGIILAGCGHRDGSDVAEAMLAFLTLDRAGAKVVCAAPDADQREVVDHLRDAAAAAISTPTALDTAHGPRNARVERRGSRRARSCRSRPWTRTGSRA